MMFQFSFHKIFERNLSSFDSRSIIASPRTSSTKSWSFKKHPDDSHFDVHAKFFLWVFQKSCVETSPSVTVQRKRFAYLSTLSRTCKFTYLSLALPIRSQVAVMHLLQNHLSRTYFKTVEIRAVDVSARHCWHEEDLTYFLWRGVFYIFEVEKMFFISGLWRWYKSREE